MTENRNSRHGSAPRLADLPIPTALKLLSVFCATVVFATLGSETALAEQALERRAGSVRVWSAFGNPTSVRLADNLRPRTAVAAEGGIVLAGEDLPSGDLFFLHQTGGATIRLPTPPSRVAPLRTHPVLIAGDQRLAGSVWLEGTDQEDFAVRASSWNGNSWENVEIVAKGGGGPQLAPAATLLEDGSWMVLWAGFDGRDDEIFWSRRVDGSWSRPRRLHRDNRVPDILPAVRADAAGEGAYAAWSSYDGNDYRILTAQWDGSSWTTGPALPGRGAIRAGFDATDEQTFLTYSSVEPEAWHLAEIDRSGTRALVRTDKPYAERPLIVVRPNSAPALAWPWRSRGARR